MWSALDRTRRRLLGVALTPTPRLDVASDVATIPASVPELPHEIVIAIGRPEFERLGAALQTVLGPGTTRPDTPARLEAALAQAIAGIGASGQTLVARRPAGLYTPEAWQVCLTDAEPVIEVAIRRAIREGVFAA